MSEYDKQRDVEAEGQRAAVYYGKQRDIAKRLTSIADASKRANDTDIPLGLELRAGAAEIDSLRATISQLQAEIARYREALEPFADVADFMDSETSGFADSDILHLVVKDEANGGIAAEFFAWPVRLFRTARAALGGSNDH